jgi:hypothetical protein
MMGLWRSGPRNISVFQSSNRELGVVAGPLPRTSELTSRLGHLEITLILQARQLIGFPRCRGYLKPRVIFSEYKF